MILHANGNLRPFYNKYTLTVVCTSLYEDPGELPKIYLSILLKNGFCLSVCLSVNLSGYAFRRALTDRVENWHGGRWWVHDVTGAHCSVVRVVQGHLGVK